MRGTQVPFSWRTARKWVSCSIIYSTNRQLYFRLLVPPRGFGRAARFDFDPFIASEKSTRAGRDSPKRSGFQVADIRV